MEILLVAVVAGVIGAVVGLLLGFLGGLWLATVVVNEAVRPA